jgi:cell division septation protein DedD
LIESVPVIPAAPAVSVFSAPIISALEKGMYYVQVAAYRNKESVEYEITRRIGKDLPVVIELNPESVGDPIYRILIGPVSFEQSAEILERYRNTFHDAIVRRGT